MTAASSYCNETHESATCKLFDPTDLFDLPFYETVMNCSAFLDPTLLDIMPEYIESLAPRRIRTWIHSKIKPTDAKYDGSPVQRTSLDRSWRASVLGEKMSSNTCQIFIKLITLSQWTAMDKARIRICDLRPLSPCNGEGDHHMRGSRLRQTIAVLLWECVLVTGIFALMLFYLHNAWTR